MVVMVVALVFGAYLYGRSQSPSGIVAENEASVTLYAEALKRVEESYVDQGEVKPKQQTYAAIEGMLNTLGDDGHTRFLSPEEVKENRQNLSGNYVGIGVTINKEDDKAVVSSSISGSPADKAGIQTGDVIVAVNDNNVKGAELSKIADKIKGPEGSEVNVTVSRDGQRQRFTVGRAELQIPAVTWRMIPGSGVAHLRLSSFNSNSTGQLEEAMKKAREEGARKFVLDLRSNPGGVLEQVKKISGQFLEPGSVIYIRRDSSGERKKIRIPDNAEPTDAPMVVLVDGGTASSAEILAGALRDNDRAKVVGVRSFGTGTVLKPFTLRDGSEVLLGIAEWLTPSGDFIRENGIKPNIKVKLKKDDEPIFPPQEKDLSRREILQRDAQLSRAFEVLN
jgi:carboxyl-terminal processing protease